jgi:hypothetical protein
MRDPTPGLPEDLTRAIAADLKPVKPSPLPLRLALCTFRCSCRPRHGLTRRLGCWWCVVARTGYPRSKHRTPIQPLSAHLPVVRYRTVVTADLSPLANIGVPRIILGSHAHGKLMVLPYNGVLD